MTDLGYDVSTIGGIIALTTFIVSQMKTWFNQTPGIKHVPIIVISICLSILLCLLAWASGMISGNVGPLVARAVFAALGSGGLYSVITGSATQTLRESAQDKVGHDDDPNKYISDIGSGPKALIFSVLLLGLCSGCASDSLTRCYQAEKTFGITLNTIADLRDQGLIPQSEVVKSKPYREAATAALFAWESSAKANNTTDAKSNEQKFNDAAAFVQRLIDVFGPARPSTRTGDQHGRSRNRLSGDSSYCSNRSGSIRGEQTYYRRRVEQRSCFDQSRQFAA